LCFVRRRRSPVTVAGRQQTACARSPLGAASRSLSRTHNNTNTNAYPLPLGAPAAAVPPGGGSGRRSRDRAQVTSGTGDHLTSLVLILLHLRDPSSSPSARARPWHRRDAPILPPPVRGRRLFGRHTRVDRRATQTFAARRVLAARARRRRPAAADAFLQLSKRPRRARCMPRRRHSRSSLARVRLVVARARPKTKERGAVRVAVALRGVGRAVAVGRRVCFALFFFLLLAPRHLRAAHLPHLPDGVGPSSGARL